ncbi:MAG TPA: class I SAM-dependent methyltransferase [Candidatus Omnitrophota bacterium]|nr:class I SAM-dependent methyltransferase [Candidatus Omnitrophota bacterium]HQO58457.1 class I SAM-dependent methyltransferase [Candidatus Omnitrophota bacterium]HQP11562.1 class I SAM-dependent methyltransferase [Candidatus Omnitrophota bacterium]
MGQCTASNWDGFWGHAEATVINASWSKKRVIRIVSPLLSGRASVLDAGCGSGFFSKFFCDQGLSVVSLDYSPVALSLTARCTGHRSQIIRADLLDPSLPGLLQKKFDVVFSDGLFEHFSREEQDVMLKNLLALLTVDGLLVTFVPNRWSPWQVIRPFFMPGIKEDPFDYSGLLDLYARNGLAVISSGGINMVPFRWSPDTLLGRRFGMLLFAVGKKSL